MQEQTGQKIKKITFILGGLVGGGAEKVASTLINELHSSGSEITLISRLEPEMDFFVIPAGVKRIVLGGEGESTNKLTALFKNLLFIWKLRRAIKKADNPVVVSFLTKTNIHTLLATIGLGIRVIISERNDTTRQNHPSPWPQLRRWLYKYSDLVTANSKNALQGMKEYVPEDRLRYVPNPVCMANKKASPHKSRLILNVGRLVPQKAQHILLEAFYKLDKSVRSDWRCEILGDGEEKENLELLIQKLQIAQETEVHGVVSYPSSYYEKAAIFILCSKYEGTPNALLEAMAHGLPVIVSNSLPGAMEYITSGENGYTFIAGDSDDLSLKIRELIINPDLRKKMGEQAIGCVEHLSVDKVMRVWEKVLNP